MQFYAVHLLLNCRTKNVTKQGNFRTNYVILNFKLAACPFILEFDYVDIEIETGLTSQSLFVY